MSSAGTGSGRAALWIEAAVLFAFWLLMSGKYDLVHVGLGLIAVGLVCWLQRRLPGSDEEKRDKSLLAFVHRLPFYFPWLLGQMIVATWQVAVIVLTPKPRLDPCIVSFKCDLPHSVAHVTLGNSITLTPGTLTLDLEGNDYRVHALTEANAEGLLSGSMQEHVARLFGSSTGRPVYDGRKIRNPEEF